jgi:GNAT superfamily N-acetyltransferase
VVGTTVNEVNLVEQAPRSGILWSGSTTVRIRPWQYEPSRAFLLIAGSHGPDLKLPDISIVEGWLNQLVDWGYSTVRTCALSPAPAQVLGGLGFESVQELSLMSAVIDSGTSHLPVPAPDIRAIRRFPGRPYSARITDALLTVDRAAFGDEWCMDSDMFDESRTATRRSRVFVAGGPDRPDGFLAIGATEGHSFLQRLAVDPRAQRRGVATRLVATGLQWAARIGCTQSIVNTATTNDPALALYRSFGFHPMEHGLHVLERSLR